MPSTGDNARETDDNGDTGLDEEELEILRDAGIIARSQKTRKRRQPRHRARHVVFVENEGEGIYAGPHLLPWRTHSCAAARQYAANENPQTNSLSQTKSDKPTNTGDLGWQQPKEKKKDTAAKARDNTAASGRAEEAKVRTLPFSISTDVFTGERRHIERVC